MCNQHVISIDYPIFLQYVGEPFKCMNKIKEDWVRTIQGQYWGVIMQVIIALQVRLTETGPLIRP